MAVAAGPDRQPPTPTSVVGAPTDRRVEGWMTGLAGRTRAAARFLLAATARHWAFALVATVGIALRIVALIAYTPSFPLRNRDAYAYLERSITFDPEGAFHPFLYSATLKPFVLADAFSWVTIVQHAAGVSLGLLLYIALCRFGVHRSVAALGAVPALLDGYQIAIEHQILTETFFEVFAVAGIVALSWNVTLRWPGAALAGFFTATSVLFRYAGLAVIAAALVYALIRRMGWRPLLIFVVSAAIPLLGYATWFHSQTGTFGLTNRNGFYLYGRVVSFADCKKVRVPAEERVFCPENLEHAPGRGLFAAGLPDEVRRDPKYNHLASSFARRMIRADPGAYASAVGTDFARYFRTRASQDHEKWLFPARVSVRDDRHVPPGISIDFRMNDSLASFLRNWQQAVSVYGPLLALFLILGVGGAIAGWATRERPPVGPEALLFTLSALGLMIFATMFAVYHFRYTIPAVPFAGAAGVSGAWAIWERFRARRSATATASRNASRASADAEVSESGT
jgi:hypothetical protein